VGGVQAQYAPSMYIAIDPFARLDAAARRDLDDEATDAPASTP
jgi:hypothetical protein